MKSAHDLIFLSNQCIKLICFYLFWRNFCQRNLDWQTGGCARVLFQICKQMKFRQKNSDFEYSIAKMKATLTFIGKLSNKVNQRLYEVSSDGGEFVIGRLREAQCMILDPNVSRRHASVKFDGKSGNWTVTDNKVWILICWKVSLVIKRIFSEPQWNLCQWQKNPTKWTVRFEQLW